MYFYSAYFLNNLFVEPSTLVHWFGNKLCEYNYSNLVSLNLSKLIEKIIFNNQH